MEPGTTTQPPPPPPYYLPGQTPAEPYLPPNQQQQPDSIVIVQDPNNEPEECCTCLCTIKWILIVLGVIIISPFALAFILIAMVLCPGGFGKKKVGHGNM